MSEIKCVDGSTSKGLFATREFQAGEIILSEDAPLIQLLAGASPSDELEMALLAELDTTGKSAGLKDHTNQVADRPSFRDCIVVPKDVDAEQESTFCSMIKMAVSFACQSVETDLKNKLLDLYIPNVHKPLPEEVEIVAVAKQALKYITEKACGSKLKEALQEGGDTLLRVMLVWSCNSFEGSRIYYTASRINHSCNPNAIVKVDCSDNEAQKIVAAATIHPGDEISISYLGTLLYADRYTRRAILKKDKHFTCMCRRCTEESDLASRIPCSSCHPRGELKQLDEDVQYDDEHTVKYMVVHKDNNYVCEHCGKSIDRSTSNRTNIYRTVEAITDKVKTFMDHACAPRDETATENDMGLDLREQLIELSSSVLGACHWTTNLLLLLELEERLKEQHESMLAGNGPPDIEIVAADIDILERIVRYVDEVQLKLHRGHLLFDAIVGVARILVSMGDVKSQKYGADWLEKLNDYVEKFEDENQEKVVIALKTAWQRGESEPAQKKPRPS
jgi:hypothetical protein